VSNNWVTSFGNLKEFISQNSDINIQEKIVRINEQVRPEFYRLFDTVLSSFIHDKLSNLVDDVAPLSNSYVAQAHQLSERLGLKAILQPTNIEGLLANPEEKSKAILFDLLFHLLKGKYDIETFEREGSKAVNADFNILLNQSYLNWTAVALLNILQPNKLLRTPIRHTVAKDVIKDRGGERVEPLQIPSPEVSQKLNFQHNPEVMLNMADSIVYSKYLQKYVALRAGLNPALRTASNRSLNREWLPIDNLSMGTSILPIYIADKPDDISLVLDNKAICRPDALVCCWGRATSNTADALLHVNGTSAALKPKYGTWVVAYHKSEYDQDNSVCLIHAGANSTLLLPILEALDKR
jgi:hypothetical protein